MQQLLRGCQQSGDSMIFSKEVLDKIEFYESEAYSPGVDKYSTITIHWKKKWWQWWIKPSVIKTCVIRSVTDTTYSYEPSNEYQQLNDQLEEYFYNLSPKPPVQLYAIKGGKLSS